MRRLDSDRPVLPLSSFGVLQVGETVGDPATEIAGIGKHWAHTAEASFTLDEQAIVRVISYPLGFRRVVPRASAAKRSSHISGRTVWGICTGGFGDRGYRRHKGRSNLCRQTRT